jgi:hypothetical protein
MRHRLMLGGCEVHLTMVLPHGNLPAVVKNERTVDDNINGLLSQRHLCGCCGVRWCG